MADETIVIDADASGLVGAVESANRRVRSLRDRMRELERAGEDASSELASVRLEIDKAGREAALAERKLRKMERGLKGVEAVGRLAGGPLGEVTGALGDLGDLAEVAGAGTVALSAAAVAGVAAFAGYAYAVGSVLMNLEDYDAQIKALEGRGVLSQHDVANMEEASDALAGVADRAAEMAVIMAADAAPAVTVLSDAMAGLLIESQAFFGGISEWIPDLNKFALGGNAIALALMYFSDAGKEAREQAKGLKTDMEKWHQTAEGLAAEMGKAPPLLQWTARDTALVAEITREKAEADREAARAAKEHADELERVDKALKSNQVSMDFARSQADAAAAAQGASNRDREAFMAGSPKSANVEAGSLGYDAGRVDGHAQMMKEIVAAEQESSQAVRDGWSQMAGVTSQFVGQVGDMIVGMFDRQIAAAEGNSRKQRELQLKQFKVAKGVAIAQATMNTAGAVIGFLANPGGPAGIALAALALATGIAQIAIIATQKPRFHMGGLLPDETMGAGAVLRQNERLAVVTEPGRESQSVADINSGAAARRSQGNQNVTFVLDGRPLRARLATGSRGMVVGHRR